MTTHHHHHGPNPQVRLANEIAVQFHHRNTKEAAEEIANHIRLFWDPRMRKDLMHNIQTDPASLDPLVLEAAKHLAP
ncbi:formate dehydrogenase subunit delta [Actinocrispum sp. NPDC049592]|uniref:formate dehydrogenase subunit delta n=1 Tax=Actinocrispum sp. NPDC049592 TaxID=3154835 RepID=UPI00341ED8F3